MKTKQVLKMLAIVAVASSVMASCTSDSKKNQASAEMKIEMAEAQLGANKAYKIPTPIDLFIRMQSLKVKFNTDLLNPVANVNIYETQLQKSMNLGVYAADLAYASLLGDSQNAEQYIGVVMKLATSLNLMEGMNKSLVERINANINESDSLLAISSDSYQDVINFIEDNGLTDVQCMVVAGAWIESLYLCFRSVGSITVSPEIEEVVADQQVLLENLSELLDANQSAPNVAKVAEYIAQIQSEYDVLYDNDGRPMTQQQLVAIVNVITDVRNNISTLKD